MQIYVAGPCTSHTDGTQDEKAKRLAENIAAAEDAGRRLTALGHCPVVPHKLTEGWTASQRLSTEAVEEICSKWVEQSEALYVVGSPPGADKELALAEKLGRPVFSVEDLPPEGTNQPDRRAEALNGYLAEYQQCAEAYRHGYETIWQAGGVFAAITAGVLALWSQKASIEPRVYMLALLPLMFWYQAVFRPMDRYGRARSDRLAEIENLLELRNPALKMKHFRHGGIQRRRLLNAPWEFLTRPRVYWYVTLLGTVLSAAEVLFWVVQLGTFLKEVSNPAYKVTAGS